MKSVRVVRIGHRYVSDYRTLTHLCLVSRALGAEAVHLEEMETGSSSRGGGGQPRLGRRLRSPRGASGSRRLPEAKEEGRTVVHLTMYGMPLQEKVAELRKRDSFLIAVGGPKVPGEAYQLADFNIAVTSQPHSEIAALGDSAPRAAKGGRT